MRKSAKCTKCGQLQEIGFKDLSLIKNYALGAALFGLACFIMLFYHIYIY